MVRAVLTASRASSTASSFLAGLRPRRSRVGEREGPVVGTGDAVRCPRGGSGDLFRSVVRARSDEYGYHVFQSLYLTVGVIKRVPHIGGCEGESRALIPLMRLRPVLAPQPSAPPSAAGGR